MIYVWRVCGRKEMHTNVLARKPEGKRQFGKHKSRWEDNIKMKHKNI
jgi:hypothetical protein